MLGRLKKIISNTENLDQNLLLEKIFNRSDVQDKVIKLQQNQMFIDGVDSKNNTLGNYSETSIKVYGKEPGHIKIYDTGEFYDSMEVRSDNSEVVISADTIKTAWDGATDLLDRWSNLLGLNEKSLSEIREYIKPIFIKMVKEAILA